jgi:TetR/AcrR family transcriptional repressor of nem operon
LLAEMNLNRGSLYGTFGDKKQLFLAALDEYEKQGRESVREQLEQPGSPRAAIENFMNGAVKNCTGESGLRGCLALKAALEMAPQDPDVAEWVRTVTRNREQLLSKVVRRAQADGEINPKLDPRAVSRFLICTLTGLKVLGTASPTEREVRDVIALMLRALD